MKGFYNLASGVLTHQRNLNVVANNMVNVSTPGYKQDRYTATTFGEVMYSRVGNQTGEGTEIGEQSYIRTTSNIYTDFTQGTVESTGIPLDFAIYGEGFFAVEDAEGNVAYTRGGSFSLDGEGYLCLPGHGRVLNPRGEAIRLQTDKIEVDAQGIISYKDGGILGQVGVFTFEDNAVLERTPMGLFTGEGAQATVEAGAVLNGCLERSNTDVVKQMTEMVTYQRSLQSATQIMKMYDEVMTKATNEIGRL